ncbi:protein of unknown function [Ralstonia solanacearum CFBP2957]|nr:protein of unknown function [Ralstonia solanacearum CFBP2957]
MTEGSVTLPSSSGSRVGASERSQPTVELDVPKSTPQAFDIIGLWLLECSGGHAPARDIRSGRHRRRGAIVVALCDGSPHGARRYAPSCVSGLATRDASVVEVRVPSVRRTLLFATGSQEAYVKTDAGKRKLSVFELQQELIQRLGVDPGL